MDRKNGTDVLLGLLLFLGAFFTGGSALRLDAVFLARDGPGLSQLFEERWFGVFESLTN